MAALSRSGTARRPYVVFSGSKVFWRTHDYIDVWILDHRSSQAMEIISYDPTLKQESPRIYLDAAVLKRKIDRSDIDRKRREAREQSEEAAIIDNLVSQALVNYILPRIVADEFSASNTFATRWQFQMGDFDGNANAPLIISRPSTLVPYQLRHKETIVGVVQQLQFTFRGAFWRAATSKLSIRERWRMPIVMRKVMRWQKLKEGDMRIFNRVKANMKTESDVERMEEALFLPTHGALATVSSSSASRGALARQVSGLARQSSTRKMDTGKGKAVASKRNSYAGPFSRRTSAQARADAAMQEPTFEVLESAAPIEYMVTAFTALGASIKSSFSTKKKTAVVPVVEAQPPKESKAAVIATTTTASTTSTGPTAVGDLALQAAVSGAMAKDSFNGLSAVTETEKFNKTTPGLTPNVSALTAQSSQLTFPGASAVKRKPGAGAGGHGALRESDDDITKQHRRKGLRGTFHWLCCTCTCACDTAGDEALIE